MSRHPLVEEWLDNWEEVRQRRPDLTLEEFMDEVCLPCCQKLIAEFQGAVSKLKQIDHVMDAVSATDAPGDQSGSPR